MLSKILVISGFINFIVFAHRWTNQIMLEIVLIESLKCKE